MTANPGASAKDNIYNIAEPNCPAHLCQLGILAQCQELQARGFHGDAILNALLGSYLCLCWKWGADGAKVQEGLHREADNYPETARRLAAANSDA